MAAHSPAHRSTQSTSSALPHNSNPQRRFTSPSATSLALPPSQPVPRSRPPSPLRTTFFPATDTGIDPTSESGSDSDDSDERARPWSPGASSSVTNLAQSLAQRVGNFMSPSRPPSTALPTDAELEAEAQAERDRSRRQAQAILEAAERRQIEERMQAMLDNARALPPPPAGSVGSPAPPRTPPTRSQSLPVEPGGSAQKDSNSPSWWAAAKNKLTPTKDLTPAQRIIEETRLREKEEAKAREREQKDREKEEKRAAKGKDKERSGEWPASTSTRDNDPALSALKNGTEAALSHLKNGGDTIRAPAPSTPPSRKAVPPMGSPVSPSLAPAPTRPIAATTPPNLTPSPRRANGTSTTSSSGPVADTSTSNPFNASTTSSHSASTQDLTRQFPSTPKMTAHELRAASPILDRTASPGPYPRAAGNAVLGSPADYTPNRQHGASPRPPPENLLHTVFTPTGALDVSETVLAVAARLEKLEKWTVNHVRALERRMVTVEEYLMEKQSAPAADGQAAAFSPGKRNATESDGTTLAPTVASAHADAELSFIRDELEELQGRVGEVGREMAELGREMRAASRTSGAQGKGSAPGSTEVGALRKEVSEIRGAVGEVRGDVNGMSCEVDRLGRAAAGLEREVEGVKHEVEGVRHEVQDVGREVARLAVAPANLSSGPSRASVQVERAPQVGSRIAVKEEGEETALGLMDGLPAQGGDAAASGLPASSASAATAPIDTSAAPAPAPASAASSLGAHDGPTPSPTAPFSPTLALGGPSPLTPVRRAPSVTARESTSPPMRSVGSAWGSGRRHGSGTRLPYPTGDYAEGATSPVGSPRGSLSGGFLSPQVTGSLMSPPLTSTVSPLDAFASAARTRPMSVSGLPSSHATSNVVTHNSGNGASAGFSYGGKNTSSYSLTTYGSASSLGSMDSAEDNEQRAERKKSATASTSLTKDAPRAASPTPLSPPRPAFTRPASASPSPPPRKRYTVALGEPITGRRREEEDEDERYAPRSHSPAPPHSPRSHSPAPGGRSAISTAFCSRTDEADDATQAGSDEEDEEYGGETIGKRQGRSTAGPTDRNGNDGLSSNCASSSAANEAASPRTRAQSVYGAQSLYGAPTAPLKPKMRSQSTDRGQRFGTAASVPSTPSAERFPESSGTGRFVDPLILRRQEREGAGKVAMPRPIGKVPINQLVAFFDGERKARE
ncbi:hypothetical protein HDZ31DRAFT_45910 [Schizophyllum fasciatum]